MIKLRVSNLPPSATAQKLNQLFSGSGKVLDTSVTDAGSGLIGFVDMEDADAQNAREQLNGSKLDDQKISVDFAHDTRIDSKDSARAGVASSSKPLGNP